MGLFLEKGHKCPQYSHQLGVEEAFPSLSEIMVVKWRLSRIKTSSDGFSAHLTAAGTLYAQLRSVWRTESTETEATDGADVIRLMTHSPGGQRCRESD